MIPLINNRYIHRYKMLTPSILGAFLSLLLFTNMASAQVTLEGPEKAEPGTLIYIKLSKLDGNDLKLTTLKNGKPSESEFQRIQDWDGNKSVQLFTKEQGTYTIVVSINKDNKTYTAVHVVTLGTPDPVKPDPKPTPGPESKLSKDLKAAYNSEKNPDSLVKLIDIYTKVRAGVKERPDVPDDYKSFKDMEQVLFNTTNAILNNGELKLTRDTIGAYLDSNISNLDTWDKQKAVTVFDEIITSLKGLQ